jgi:hypothetical protein
LDFNWTLSCEYLSTLYLGIGIFLMNYVHMWQWDFRLCLLKYVSFFIESRRNGLFYQSLIIPFPTILPFLKLVISYFCHIKTFFTDRSEYLLFMFFYKFLFMPRNMFYIDSLSLSVMCNHDPLFLAISCCSLSFPHFWAFLRISVYTRINGNLFQLDFQFLWDIIFSYSRVVLVFKFILFML